MGLQQIHPHSHTSMMAMLYDRRPLDHEGRAVPQGSMLSFTSAALQKQASCFWDANIVCAGLPHLTAAVPSHDQKLESGYFKDRETVSPHFISFFSSTQKPQMPKNIFHRGGILPKLWVPDGYFL